MMLAVASPKI